MLHFAKQRFFNDGLRAESLTGQHHQMRSVLDVLHIAWVRGLNQATSFSWNLDLWENEIRSSNLGHLEPPLSSLSPAAQVESYTFCRINARTEKNIEKVLLQI